MSLLIKEQFDSLFKNTSDLAREAIRANMELSMCGQISYYKTTLQRLKRNALSNLELRGSMDSLHLNSRMDDGIRDEIDLSIGNKSKSRMRSSDQDIQVRNTMGGSRANIMVTEVTERLSLGLPFDYDDEYVPRGQVVDKVGQRSPCSIPFGIDDEYMIRGQVVDNVG